MISKLIKTSKKNIASVNATFSATITATLLIIFCCTFLLAGCSNQKKIIQKAISKNEISQDAITQNVSQTINFSSNNANAKATSKSSEDSTPPISESDMVPFDIENAFSYCDQPVCKYDKATDKVSLSIHFNTIPKSDDAYIYLFEMESYEEDTAFIGKHYLAKAFKDNDVTLSVQYSQKRLFSKFVPVISYGGQFVPISLGQHLTNPEDLSDNDTPYLEVESKKGLLLDPMTLDKEELYNLNVRRVVYNIPLSYIMGETYHKNYPTIEYKYRGKTYKFNGYMLSGFDNLFSDLTKNNYHITAIVLNDWNELYPELIHPLSRKKTSTSEYYAFNTEDEDGVRLMEAVSLFLSDRYSNGEYGLVQDWVIANEVNQQKIWNYMATEDLDLYTDSFERSFRTFYNAIKSNYKNANVYFSIDHDWNDNYGSNYSFFNGKDFMNKFNELAKSRGNYDWALSIHPYPSPLSKTRFWYDRGDKSENAGVITPMNLTVLTDFMQQKDFLDTNGDVRKIGITELGFSSKSGEKVHAAAFAYCYKIIEDNEFINSFLMNRQTDSYASLKSGLALGIYNPDYSAKYIVDVFTNIDTEACEEYIQEMLEIIGAKDLEEALSWAK